MALSADCLLGAHSYRLGAKSQSDMLIVAREFKAVLTGIWQKTPAFSFVAEGDTTSAIISGQPDTEDFRRKYLQFITQKNPALFLHRPGLMAAKDTSHRILFTLLLISWFPALFISGLISPKRVNYALLQREFIDLSNALLLLEEHRIRKLYFFNIFGIDTNLIAVMAMKKGVHITKIPADVPIGLVNKTIIADTLATCTKYQEEESRFFPNVQVKEIVNWLPEHFLQYVGVYDLPNQYATPPKSLGFYSSGSWRRQELGHSNPSEGFFGAEASLIEFLQEYMQAHPEISFTVFPHPLEKKTDEVFERTKAFYKEKFKGIDVEFPEKAAATTRIFDRIDVSVSIYSTVSFERLFMGFKSTFFPMNIPDFPIPNSGMKRISAKSKQELFTLLDRSLHQSREDFFEKNELSGYSIEDYRDKFDF